MPTARWPATLFDLDGTLVDTIPLIVASFEYAFRAVLGRDVDEGRIRQSIGRPLIEAFRDVEPARAQELFDVYSAWNLENSERYITPMSGVRDMLVDLVASGASVGVVTSKRRSSADLALRLTGLDDVIRVLAALEDTTRHKPHPEPLRHALSLMGHDESAACYVGDATVDLLAARAAGVDGVGVTWGAGERAALEALPSVALVDSPAQLAAVLLSR